MATTLPARQQFHALREVLVTNTFMERIGQVLPKHLTAERMIRIALHAVNRQPLLLQCTHESMMQAIMDASQLGLEPSSVLGTAYLVPFGREVKLIPGYQGLIDLARRSGHVLSIEARVVYAGDEFEYEYGTSSFIKHKPSLVGGIEISADGSAVRPILAFYAVAHLKDARPQFEIMSKAEVDAIRKRSKAASNSPWVTDYAEMGRKTAVRRLSKYIPKSPELAHALEIEDRAEGFGDFLDISAELADGESQIPPAPQTPTERLKSRLQSRHAPKERVTDDEIETLRTYAREHGVTELLETALKPYHTADGLDLGYSVYESIKRNLDVRVSHAVEPEGQPTDAEPLIGHPDA